MPRRSASAVTAANIAATVGPPTYPAYDPPGQVDVADPLGAVNRRKKAGQRDPHGQRIEVRPARVSRFYVLRRMWRPGLSRGLHTEIAKPPGKARADATVLRPTMTVAHTPQPIRFRSATSLDCAVPHLPSTNPTPAPAKPPGRPARTALR